MGTSKNHLGWRQRLRGTVRASRRHASAAVLRGGRAFMLNPPPPSPPPPLEAVAKCSLLFASPEVSGPSLMIVTVT